MSPRYKKGSLLRGLSSAVRGLRFLVAGCLLLVANSQSENLFYI